MLRVMEGGEVGDEDSALPSFIGDDEVGEGPEQQQKEEEVPLLQTWKKEQGKIEEVVEEQGKIEEVVEEQETNEPKAESALLVTHTNGVESNSETICSCCVC